MPKKKSPAKKVTTKSAKAATDRTAATPKATANKKKAAPAAKTRTRKKTTKAAQHDRKPPAKKTKRASTRSTPVEPPTRIVDRAAIERLAYEKWEQAGCPVGDGSEFWEAAERELGG